MILWIQNGNVVKGEIDFKAKIVTFYDKFGNIVMIRRGLTTKQLKDVAREIQKQLAKRNRVGYYYI